MAISESNPEENDPTPKVAMSITGGTFNGEITLTDTSKCIKGGSYSVAPSKSYVADGYKVVDPATEGGYYTIGEAPTGQSEKGNTDIPEGVTAIASQKDFATALVAGGTIYLGEGTFTIPFDTAVASDATFIGSGAGKTTVKYGSTEAMNGEHGSYYGFAEKTVKFVDTHPTSYTDIKAVFNIKTNAITTLNVTDCEYVGEKSMYKLESENGSVVAIN